MFRRVALATGMIDRVLAYAPPALARMRPDRYERAKRTAQQLRHSATAFAYEVHRIQASGREVLLPKGVSFEQYAAALEKSRVFPDPKISGLSTEPGPPLENDPRPLIGVMISVPQFLGGDASHKDRRSAAGLIAKVEALGARAVLIPPCLDLVMATKDRTRAIHDLVAPLDGLLGPGGEDVHPRLYGQRNRWSYKTKLARDRFEADVAVAGMNADLYMLGVCRSHQLWNAAAGGSLEQDVERAHLASSTQHQEKAGLREDDPFHVVDVAGGTRLHSVVDADRVETNSLHHQVVIEPGRDFEVSATVHDFRTHATMIEATEGPNALTVQWHPELSGAWADADRALIETFVRRTRVFKMIREMRRNGENPTLAALRARLELSEADLEWLKRDLAPRLSRCHLAAR